VRHSIRAVAGIALAGASLALAACTSSGSTGPSSGVVTVPGQSGGGTPVKDGTVTVRGANGKVVCVMTIANGKGTCKVPAKNLAAGSNKLTGTYDGSGNKTAKSQPVYVTVTEPGSTVSLSAPGQVTYGHEQSAKLSVRVTASAGGTPTGKVTVLSTGKIICTVTLSGGAGSCTPSPTALPAGAHSLVASYSGDKAHTGSSSALLKITVAG